MADEPKVGMTVLGKIVLVLFILLCLGGAAFYFKDTLLPKGAKGSGKTVDLDAFRTQVGKVEAPDTKGITTLNEYTYLPSEKLPPVKGVSAYKWDPKERVVNFPINVQIDWSNGGDGIVVRGNIHSVKDLKGKVVVYAQNSPSQYFINNLLLQAGLQPGEVTHK